MTRRARTFPVLLSVALAFVVWFVVARLGWVGKSLLASPGEVAGVLARALRPANSGQAVFTHAAHTVGRALAGWAIALTGGGVIGLLLGWSSRVYRATEPLFEFARAIPPIMAFPLFLVAFDFGAPRAARAKCRCVTRWAQNAARLCRSCWLKAGCSESLEQRPALRLRTSSS